ncbi:MAG: glycosyltransferase family 1 protein [Lachnospiraceae bacterium]|nr:glycosyltransferase family 1 protein [Lachnospiraceae bacterium]
MRPETVHVFLVSSKGIPARYGGFETFVENLTAKRQEKRIQYHVSCMDCDEKHFVYNDADCFNVKLPARGAPGRILHVARVLYQIEEWRKANEGEKTVVYILGCRIGPLIIPYARKLRKMDVKIFVNPDGLEWKRDKWNKWQKSFLKYCEKCLIMNGDLVVCDSVNIERYVCEKYPHAKGKTTYIAYGTDLKASKCPNEKLDKWLRILGAERGQYYLIVGRFVPENNYETMITEFLRSSAKKPLLIITNVENNKFYKDLKEKTCFDQDGRIKFAGTVYDTELLKKIRECAYAYIHGHEVGGTNPSLLEALASTKLNLLLDVEFNREVAGAGALYWKKDELAEVVNAIDNADSGYCEKLYKKNRDRMADLYSWEKICKSYEKIFIDQAEAKG